MSSSTGKKPIKATGEGYVSQSGQTGLAGKLYEGDSYFDEIGVFKADAASKTSLNKSGLTAENSSGMFGGFSIPDNMMNGNFLSGVADLGSLAMQLASYDDMKKQARINIASAQHNLDQARLDAGRKQTKIDNINRIV